MIIYRKILLKLTLTQKYLFYEFSLQLMLKRVELQMLTLWDVREGVRMISKNNPVEKWTFIAMVWKVRPVL